jgi:heme exporter protein C
MLAINPNILSRFLNSISQFIIILSLFLICVAGVLIFFLENDYYQGISFKIMFIHVPAAWLSLMFFLLWAQAVLLE